MGIRKGNGMVAPVTLRESQAGVFGGPFRRPRRSRWAARKRCTHHRVIVLAEIVIDTQRAGVLSPTRRKMV